MSMSLTVSNCQQLHLTTLWDFVSFGPYEFLSIPAVFAVCMNVESVFKREAFLLEWALALSLYFNTTAIYCRLTTLFILPYSVRLNSHT